MNHILIKIQKHVKFLDSEAKNAFFNELKHELSETR